MTYKTLVCALVSFLLVGCSNLQDSYKTTTTVSTAGRNQYKVGWLIETLDEKGRRISAISTPKAIVRSGTKAEIQMGEDKVGNGVFCTALFNEKANTVESHTTVLIKERGKTTLNTSQKTIFKK